MSFRMGRVIVSTCKDCQYLHALPCKNCPLFELGKPTSLFRPYKTNKDTSIGAVLLLHLFDPRAAIEEVIKLLKGFPCIISAEPDYFIHSHARVPNDEYFDELWGMRTVEAPSAWDIVTGNMEVSVGILDSGIDFGHPDLKENLLFALSERQLYGVFGGTPLDETGHGTHVAGTIGAVGNNTIGVCGICWKTGLISLKIGGQLFNLASAIKAIDFAVKNKINVLNASWGSPFFSLSLEYAINHYDGVFVASAGNSGSNNDIFPIYPASFDCQNLISVAAIDTDNILAEFSNYGAASVHIAAPGVGILSTDLNSSYSYMDGTSMAAPHVAGTAALLKALRPQLEPTEVRDIILSTADLHSSLTSKTLSGGSLNVYKAISSAQKIVV